MFSLLSSQTAILIVAFGQLIIELTVVLTVALVLRKLNQISRIYLLNSNLQSKVVKDAVDTAAIDISNKVAMDASEVASKVAIDASKVAVKLKADQAGRDDKLNQLLDKK